MGRVGARRDERSGRARARAPHASPPPRRARRLAGRRGVAAPGLGHVMAPGDPHARAARRRGPSRAPHAERQPDDGMAARRRAARRRARVVARSRDVAQRGAALAPPDGHGGDIARSALVAALPRPRRVPRRRAVARRAARRLGRARTCGHHRAARRARDPPVPLPRAGPGDDRRAARVGDRGAPGVDPLERRPVATGARLPTGRARRRSDPPAPARRRRRHAGSRALRSGAGGARVPLRAARRHARARRRTDARAGRRRRGA